MVRVQINDPKNLLGTTEKATGNLLLVGAVAANGLSKRQPAIKLTSPTGRNYNVLVPLDQAVTIQLVNPGFTFQDANGNVLSSGLIEIPATYSSKGTNAPIVLTVTGTTAH
jgi:hypothetical protein